MILLLLGSGKKQVLQYSIFPNLLDTKYLTLNNLKNIMLIKWYRGTIIVKQSVLKRNPNHNDFPSFFLRCENFQLFFSLMCFALYHGIQSSTQRAN